MPNFKVVVKVIHEESRITHSGFEYLVSAFNHNVILMPLMEAVESLESPGEDEQE